MAQTIDRVQVYLSGSGYNLDLNNIWSTAGAFWKRTNSEETFGQSYIYDSEEFEYRFTAHIDQPWYVIGDDPYDSVTLQIEGDIIYDGVSFGEGAEQYDRIDASSQISSITFGYSAAGVFGSITLEDGQFLPLSRWQQGGDLLADRPSSLNGSAGNDTIRGGNQDDWLSGGLGSDVLDGRAGPDIINSGRFLGSNDGPDTVTGGEGTDTFWVNATGPQTTADTITDFEDGESIDVWLTNRQAKFEAGQILDGDGSKLLSDEIQILRGKKHSIFFVGNDANPGSDGRIIIKGDYRGITFVTDNWDTISFGGLFTSGVDRVKFDKLDANQRAAAEGADEAALYHALAGDDLVTLPDARTVADGVTFVTRGEDDPDGARRFVGGAGDDTIRGGVRRDYIDGGDDNDTIGGDRGADDIKGGKGDDRLLGQDGDDVLWGVTADEKGVNTLDGGDDYDTAKWGFGREVATLVRFRDTTSTTNTSGFDIWWGNGRGGVDRLSNIEAMDFNGDIITLDKIYKFGVVEYALLAAKDAFEQTKDYIGRLAEYRDANGKKKFENIVKIYEYVGTIVTILADAPLTSSDTGFYRNVFVNGLVAGLDPFIDAGEAALKKLAAKIPGPTRTTVEEAVDDGAALLRQQIRITASKAFNAVLDASGDAGAAVGETYYRLLNTVYKDASERLDPLKPVRSLENPLIDWQQKFEEPFCPLPDRDKLPRPIERGNGDDDVERGGDAPIIMDLGRGDDRGVSGSGRDLLAGGPGNDVLISGAAKDILDGGRGADRMSGGAQSDAYVVDNRGDRVIEGRSKGTDNVASSISYTLAANVENLTLTSRKDLDGVGNRLDNVIRGNAGDNALSGGAGEDRLIGSAGSDKLTGGLGLDVLTGGNGADRFVFRAEQDSLRGSKHDVITDFDRGEDRIDLRGIDGNAERAGRQDPDFIDRAAFSKTPGELRFSRDMLLGDTDGDGRADFVVEVRDVARLGENDFLL